LDLTVLNFVNNNGGQFEIVDWNLDGKDDVLALIDDDQDEILELIVLVSNGVDQFSVLRDVAAFRSYPDERAAAPKEPFVGEVEFLDIDGDGRLDMVACEAVVPCQRINYSWEPGFELPGCRDEWVFALRTDDGFDEFQRTGVPTECSFEYDQNHLNNFMFTDRGPDMRPYPASSGARRFRWRWRSGAAHCRAVRRAQCRP
jgi:hypothetical protein